MCVAVIFHAGLDSNSQYSHYKICMGDENILFYIVPIRSNVPKERSNVPRGTIQIISAWTQVTTFLPDSSAAHVKFAHSMIHPACI